MAKSNADTLRKLAFFSTLPETLVWHLGRAAERRALAQDEILFREGDPRTIFAVIVSGNIDIEKTVEGSAARIASLGAGEVIGEGVLLEEGVHRSVGRATESTELFVFKREPLMKLLKDQPALYAALLARTAKIMNDRIRNANANLLDTRTDWPTGRAEVRRWIEGIADMAESMGADKAIQAAREALDAGRDISSLAPNAAAK
jgi:aspartate ammonia-lyase